MSLEGEDSRASTGFSMLSFPHSENIEQVFE